MFVPKDYIFTQRHLKSRQLYLLPGLQDLGDHIGAARNCGKDIERFDNGNN